MVADLSLEERKINTLMKLRRYQVIERKEQETIVSFLVEDPKEDEKVLIWCTLDNDAMGVRRIEKVKKAIDAVGATRGIVVSRGKYTQAARVKGKRMNIELIPKNFPSFNIFDHVLVPKHELLTSEEKKKIMKKYRIKPFQLPKIKESDPAIIAIGGRPGDVVRVIRDSPTAGKYIAYRFVI